MMRHQVTHRGRFGGHNGYSGYVDTEPPSMVPKQLLCLALLLFCVYAYQGWVVCLWLSVVALLLTVAGMFRVVARRQAFCEKHGHDPYQPVPHLREYRCWHCHAELPADYPLSRVERAAREHAQAFYSDRR